MTLETMTKEERKEIQMLVKGLDEAADAIRHAIDPHLQAIASLDGMRDELLVAKGNLEVAGECINCECILFYGDKGYRYEEGELSCSECAPTWEDVEKNMKAAASDDEEHAAAYAEFKTRFDAFAASGGNIAEIFPYTI